MMAGLGPTAMVEVPLRVEADPLALVGLVAPVPPRGMVVATTSRTGAFSLPFSNDLFSLT